MAEHKVASFSSVLSIDPYKEEFYTSTSNFITQTNEPKYAKDQYAISFIDSKTFMHAHIGISKNIPQEDTYDVLFNKVYDELALDQAVEYTIQYIESFNILDEENRYYHVFIVDPSIIQNQFNNVISQVNYIDTIIPASLLIKTLYTRDIITSSGTDCYIYIQDNDAFLTLYSEQNFLYTKTLKFSLAEMHERFCEIYGERVSYEGFINFLETQNLKYTDSEYKDAILTLYREFFANINDILTFAKRAYDLNKIDTLYIGSSLDFASKLDEIAGVELSIKSYVFEFDLGFTSEAEHIEQLHQLMHFYTTLSDEEKYVVNFTLFPRPPKFIQRQSGKLIVVTAVSFVLAFIYPVTYWTLTYLQGFQLTNLQTQYNEIHTKKVAREATIKAKQSNLQKLQKLVNAEKKKFEDKKTTLAQINRVKNSYIMKADILTTLTKDFNKFDIRLESLGYTEEKGKKEFTFNLVSKNSTNITELLKYITDVHQNSFRFSIDKIIFDKESKRYFSQLKAIKQ
jgi:hypothetical protein